MAFTKKHCVAPGALSESSMHPASQTLGGSHPRTHTSIHPCIHASMHPVAHSYLHHIHVVFSYTVLLESVALQKVDCSLRGARGCQHPAELSTTRCGQRHRFCNGAWDCEEKFSKAQPPGARRRAGQNARKIAPRAKTISTRTSRVVPHPSTTRA